MIPEVPSSLSHSRLCLEATGCDRPQGRRPNQPGWRIPFRTCPAPQLVSLLSRAHPLELPAHKHQPLPHRQLLSHRNPFLIRLVVPAQPALLQQGTKQHTNTSHCTHWSDLGVPCRGQEAHLSAQDPWWLQTHGREAMSLPKSTFQTSSSKTECCSAAALCKLLPGQWQGGAGWECRAHSWGQALHSSSRAEGDDNMKEHLNRPACGCCSSGCSTWSRQQQPSR